MFSIASIFKINCKYTKIFFLYVLHSQLKHFSSFLIFLAKILFIYFSPRIQVQNNAVDHDKNYIPMENMGIKIVNRSLKLTDGEIGKRQEVPNF